MCGEDYDANTELQNRWRIARKPHLCFACRETIRPGDRLPKPVRRVKAPRPLRRGKHPRSRMPKALGVYRERVKYARTLWVPLIRAKEPSGICPSCRTRPWHDAAHGWPKGPYPAMQFELDNGIPLCRVCHRRVDSDFHAKRELWLRYVGLERYRRLELMAQARGKMDLDMTILFLESLTIDTKRAEEAQ